MFKSKTVIVVGAGASFEVGMPVGDELKSEIASLVNIRFPDGYTQKTGDYRITEALKRIVESSGGRDINPYLHAGWHISDALAQAISIDNFLDCNDDALINVVGKLGIVRAILKRERSSRLFLRDGGAIARLDFKSLSDTWLHYFFQLLTEGTKSSKLDEIFHNISIVSFNYDRCIEHFLFNALQNYYNIDTHRAAEIAGQLEIFYPYGSIASLPWRNSGGKGIHYGAEDGYDLAKIYGNIKTFTEQVEDEAYIDAIRNRIQAAKHLVFIGFAFHDANMALLQPHAQTSIERVFATALNISESDCNVIGNRIGKLCLAEDPEWDWEQDALELHNSLTAAAMFREFGRSLRS